MAEATQQASLDVATIRDDFPILSRTVYGKPLVYLDNASTSQKPRQVISALTEYYEGYNSNVHRGVHALSMEATDRFVMVPGGVTSTGSVVPDTTSDMGDQRDSSSWALRAK